MKRVVGVAAAIALASIAAVVLLRHGGDALPCATAAGADAPGATADPAVGDADSGHALIDSYGSRAERQVAPAPSTAPPAGASSRRLRIVDERGLPLADAEYFEGPLPSDRAGGLSVFEALQEQWHPDRWLGRRCVRQVADANGTVTPHTTDTPQLYLARHDGRLAWWDWSADAETLRVAPERSCRITVVDPAGTPVAGAAVVLRAAGNNSDAEPIVGVTDATGACTVSHLQRLAPSEGWLRPDLLPRFGVRGLGLRSADVAFDGTAPPAELRLRLPPCGMVAVELLDRDGARMASSQRLRLSNELDESLVEYAKSSGPADFGLVACGAELTAAVGRGQAPAASRHLAGPRVSGERVVLTLGWVDLVGSGCAVVGRALLPDHTPAAHTMLDVSSAWATSEQSPTDGDGRFAFLFEGEAVASLREANIRITERRDADDWRRFERRGAVCPLPDPLHSGLVDLGTIVLQDASILVQGRIRSSLGPVTEPRIDAGAGREVTVTTDGRFEVRGVAIESTVTLDIGARACARRRIDDVAVGTKDLDVVLQPTGSLRAVVQVERKWAELYRGMRIDLVDARGMRHRAMVGPGDSGWDCAWRVPPDVYDLEVRPFAAARPMVEVQRIVVAPGDEAQGEPLVLDLRGRLRSMRLSWVDGDGQVVQVGFAHVIARSKLFLHGEERYCEGMRADDFGCSLLGTEEPMNLNVEGIGFTATYSGPCVDATVKLTAVAEVPFRIPGLPDAPDDGEWTVRAIAESGEAAIRIREIQDQGQDYVWRHGGWVFGQVDADGHGVLRLAPDSRYTIELLFGPGKTSTRRFHAVSALPPRLDVGAELPAELVLRFPAEELQAVVR